MVKLMMDLDIEAWEERSAIIEYDGGFSRFEAETLAAKAQGVSRHDAIRIRNSAKGGNNMPPAQRDAAHNLPRVQPSPEKENGSMPVGDVQAGRDSVELLALRT